MSPKKFIGIFFICSFIFALFVHVFVFIIDPLFYYRTPSLYEPQYIAEERYQMPGLVKNMDYETLIVGSSMSRNFVETDINEKFNTTSFNAALPSGMAYEQNRVVTLANNTHELKRVLWEVNPHFYEKGIKETLNPEDNMFPAYMYDQNPLNDIRYSLSLYTFETFIKNVKANKEHDPSKRDVEKLYKFGNGVKPQTIEEMLKQIEETEPSELTKFQTVEHMKKSFDFNIVEIVEKNPNIEFIFFYPPYPITYHVRSDITNPEITENRDAFKKYVYETLSKYDNVELFDFQAKEDLTFYMSKYMDGVHYYKETNAWMAEVMAEAEPSIWQDAELQRQKLYDQIKNFHASQLKE